MDFAENSQQFQTKREAFVASRIHYWETKIDFAIDDFEKNNGIKIIVPSTEVKKKAAELLAHAELGIKLVFNRYHPTEAKEYDELKFSVTNIPSSIEHIFRYHHTPRIPWGSVITVQLQWLLDMAQYPERWYQEYKKTGKRIGAVNLDTPEDLFLFSAIEEASHNLYLNHTTNYFENRKSPSGEFYYAEDWEFQALKVLYFFAKKYKPEYELIYRNELLKMVQHRKQQSKAKQSSP